MFAQACNRKHCTAVGKSQSDCDGKHYRRQHRYRACFLAKVNGVIMSCPQKKQPEYKTSVTYVSDGRDAMWHLPFPFLHPSDISVKIIDKLGIEKQLYTPNDFVVYWDFICCVVKPGYRIRIDLIPPLEKVLAGKTAQKKNKQVLDRHKVQAILPEEYVNESMGYFTVY